MYHITMLLKNQLFYLRTDHEAFIIHEILNILTYPYLVLRVILLEWGLTD